jgi:hypothetical protein
LLFIAKKVKIRKQQQNLPLLFDYYLLNEAKVKQNILNGMFLDKKLF